MSASSSTTRTRSPVTGLAAAVTVRRSARSPTGEPPLNLGDDHLDGDGVVAAARNDHVGVALGRLDELQMHRLHGREVLVEDFIERPAALGHVAANASNESDVGVGIDEDFDVAEVAHARIAEQQNAVDHDDLGRWNDHRAIAPGVAHEIVDRLLDRTRPPRGARAGRSSSSQSNASG